MFFCHREKASVTQFISLSGQELSRHASLRGEEVINKHFNKCKSFLLYFRVRVPPTLNMAIRK